MVVVCERLGLHGLTPVLFGALMALGHRGAGDFYRI